MTKVTREFFANLADNLEIEYTKKMMKRGLRDEYNATFRTKRNGVWSLEKELNSKLQLLNNRCISYGFAALYEEEEEQPVQPMKRVE